MSLHTCNPISCQKPLDLRPTSRSSCTLRSTRVKRTPIHVRQPAHGIRSSDILVLLRYYRRAARRRPPPRIACAVPQFSFLCSGPPASYQLRRPTCQ